MKTFYGPIILLALCFFTFGTLAQNTFFNQGQVYVMPNAIVHVNGNMETNGATAVLDNNGIITVANSTLQGDFTLDNSANVQGSGDYLVEGDWINSPVTPATFTPNNSYVNLRGGNQLITGTLATTFYNLELTGTGTVKTQTIDATVQDSLVLNDVELATDANTMFVTNTSTSAVTNNVTFGSEGFVSSLAGGALSWTTASNSMYLFPVGSSLGTRRYRPAQLLPAAASANTYTVRLANNSGTADSYDIDALDTSLCRLNPYFYHVINRTSGTDAADIALYYDASSDGTYDALAQWDTPSSAVWNDMGMVTAGSASYSYLDAPAWNDFSREPFALAVSGAVSASIDTSFGGFFNETVFFNDNGSGADTWSWDFGDGDTASTQNPRHEYGDPGTYTVQLISSTSNGCADTSEVVIVVPESIIIPNVFSPNGDGVNDQFVIPTVGIGEYKLSIYNRWGTLLFESVAPAVVWDGRTFAGEEATDGVYYFILTAVGSEDYSTTGHVTLLR